MSTHRTILPFSKNSGVAQPFAGQGIRTAVRHLIIALALAAWLVPPTTRAAGGLLDLSLQGYASFLNSEDADTAVGGGAKLKLDVIEYFAADVRASYLKYDEGDLEIVPLEGTVMIQLPLLSKTVNPYAGVGVGYYMFQSGDVRLEDSVGVAPLLGCEVRLGKEKHFGLFGEVRWLFLDPDFEDTSGSADLSGVGVNLGVGWHF